MNQANVVVDPARSASREPLSDRAVARLFMASIVGSIAAWLSLLIAVIAWLFGAA